MTTKLGVILLTCRNKVGTKFLFARQRGDTFQLPVVEYSQDCSFLVSAFEYLVSLGIPPGDIRPLETYQTKIISQELLVLPFTINALHTIDGTIWMSYEETLIDPRNQSLAAGIILKGHLQRQSA